MGSKTMGRWNCPSIWANIVWFSLIGFYGISTLVRYLIPNIVFTLTHTHIHTHTHTHIYIYIYNCLQTNELWLFKNIIYKLFIRIYIYIYIRILNKPQHICLQTVKWFQVLLYNSNDTLPSRLGLWNILTAALQRGKTTSMSVLDIILNNLMVRFQWCCGFGECGAPFHCHCSQVHAGPTW